MSTTKHTPDCDAREYDEAVEALRRGLNALPRFSFLRDANDNIIRVPDRYGRYIEWQSAHELFDAVVVDSLISKLRAAIAISKAKATGEPK